MQASGNYCQQASALLEQAFVISHHEVTVDFLDQVKRDANRDQKARAAVEAGDHVVDAQKFSDDRWNNRD